MILNSKIPPELTVSGAGGAPGEGEIYIPVESGNSLQANTIARLTEAVLEGEIEGPANDNNWYKSTYLNETQVMADDGTMNFNGVTIVANTGTPNQDYLPGHDEIESETLVNTQVEKNIGAIAHTIHNSEIDDLRVTVQVPRLVYQTTKGDLVKTSVSYRITVTPGNGAGSEQTAVDGQISGKCITPYRKQHRIKNLSQYGAAPWVIKMYRLTVDSLTSKMQNETWWYSYAEIINVKLRYPDTVMVGLTLNSKLFGNRMPSRVFKLKGKKIQYPSNYNPTTRQYTGIWDGTFTTGYCNNPAWVLYDMVVNTRFGVGLVAAYADKWTLYTIGQYCDGDVTYKKKIQQPDGSYTTQEIIGPRFTFNGLIQDRNQALAVIAHMCSVFMGFPIWSSGMLSFVQDAPRTMDHKAHPANVEDGFFEYEGTGISQRTTAVLVSFNDPDNFGRPKIVPIVDSQSVARYGYNKKEIVAFGCNSEAEATRRAKFILDTNTEQTDTVKFVGGMAWADAVPGEIVGVQDPAYTNKNLHGRIVSSTATSVTVDRDIEIEDGISYTLYIPDSVSKTLHERTLTNVPGATRILTFTGDISPVPQPEFDFVLSSSSDPVRLFEIIGKTETDDIKYGITGIEYDPDKHTRIESNVVIEAPPTPGVPFGKMAAPASLVVQPYPYVEGDQDIRKYGMLISWDAVDDPRCQVYELIASYNDGGWYPLGDLTAEATFDYKDVAAGTYDFAVRGKGVAVASNWTYKNGFVMGCDVDAPAPPTELHCVDDPVNEYFKGPDCEITWVASIGSNYTIPADPGNDIPFEGAQAVGESNVAGYQIEVYNGTDLKRTHISEGRSVLSWAYTLAMNAEDNGSPIRNINFRVYTIDVKKQLSLTYASLSASNPAPSMSSMIPTILSMAGHLDISWPLVSDNDMMGYEIKVDTIKQGMVAHPANDFRFHDVEVGTPYNVQIVPHDHFGPGTGSQTNTGSPTKIPAINLDVELSASMEKTDSDGNTPAVLESLYDGTYGASGVEYILTGTDKWIQYKFGLATYIDRVQIWTNNAHGQVYLALSQDGTAWSYFKAESDHSLNGDALSLATNQVDAKTNYWQMAPGENLALLPNNVAAQYVRLYLTGTYTTTIHEFIPPRITLSEMGAIKDLAALSIKTGTLYVDELIGGLFKSIAQTTSGASVTEIDMNNARATVKDLADNLLIEWGKLLP